MQNTAHTGGSSLDYQEPEQEGITPLEILHKLWHRRRLLITTALFIIAIGLIMLHQKVPRYTATSSLMIGITQSKVVDIEAVITGIGTGNYQAVAAEIEVLRSSDLARKVVKKYDLVLREEFNPSLRAPGLSSYLNPVPYIKNLWTATTASLPAEKPEKPQAEPVPAPIDPDQVTSSEFITDSWKLALEATPEQQATQVDLPRQQEDIAVAIFLSKLGINPIADFSNVVNVSFESTDPALAAKIANDIPETYIIDQLEAKYEATEKATKWLNNQLSELKIKVEASEQAVQTYREQYDITATKGSEIVIEQLSAINSQLIIARSERAQAEARLRQIRKLSGGSDSAIETASEVLSSPIVQRLTEQEAELTRRASELSTVYGVKHPKMIQVNAEITELRNRIRQEIGKVVSGLQNEVEVARLREQSLEQSLAELKQASGQQNQESVQLRALEREAEANRALFETFLNRFKEASSTSGLQEADARVISQAKIPGAPSYPNKRRATLMIIFGAFAFSAALVLVLEAFSPGLTNPEQMEKQLGLPAIGLIPLVKGGEPSDYALKKPHSSYGEALNSLRTSLILSNPDEAVTVVQFTSSIPEEGKSTLALSFARLLTSSGKKVILVDADLRRASLEDKIGVSATSKGLTDLVMSDGSDLREFVIQDSKSPLLIMPKGGAEYVNAIDIFSSKRMENIVAHLKKHFDYVIFDAPPIMAVSDAKILGRLVDKTVFIVRWDKTPKKVISAALKQLQDHDVDIAGSVLQQVNLKRYGRYGYGDSGYYYHYGKYGKYYSS